jgi:GTP-binding protein
MRYVPVAFLTSQAGRNVRPVVDLAQSLFKQARERVGTGKLNSVVRAAMEKNPPPVKKNRRPKIFFSTQVAVTPPTIVLKCNEPALLGDDWKRYLLTQLRDSLPFPEIPIRLYFRPRGKDEDGNSSRR